MDDLCPRKILSLPTTFTLEELKKQYKKMVIKMHPDMKNVSDISSTANFQILTTCYKVLLKELEIKETEKDFVNLKNDSASYTKKQPTVVNKNISPDSFNIDKFNVLFSNSRVADPYDTGYDKWMNENKNTTNNGTIIKYKEPEAYTSSSLGGYLLGVEKITDFSGDNMSDRSLNFMDYKVAYTTPTIDNNIDKIKKRKEYKNLEALELDRSKIKFEVDPKLAVEIEKKKMYAEMQEAVRLKNIASRDAMVANNFAKSHGAFINIR
jgi:hypothetical protein